MGRTNEKITMIEAMRSVLYVPIYLAFAKHEWAKEGLDVELVTPTNPARAFNGITEGHGDIGIGATVRVIRAHDEKQINAPVCFAQLVERDPFVIIGAQPNDNFSFEDLKTLKLAVAQEAPLPWLGLSDDLRRSDIDPQNIKLSDGAKMAMNTKHLINGDVDAIQVFEPHAAKLRKQNHGHIWHRFATRGPICFSSLFTGRKFATENRLKCAAITRVLSRAQDIIFSETANEIAKQIRHYLPDIEYDVLSQIIEDYRSSGVWAQSPKISKDAFIRLKSILIAGQLIKHDIPYEDVVFET